MDKYDIKLNIRLFHFHGSLLGKINLTLNDYKNENKGLHRYIYQASCAYKTLSGIPTNRPNHQLCFIHQKNFIPTSTKPTSDNKLLGQLLCPRSNSKSVRKQLFLLFHFGFAARHGKPEWPTLSLSVQQNEKKGKEIWLISITLWKTCYGTCSSRTDTNFFRTENFFLLSGSFNYFISYRFRYHHSLKTLLPINHHISRGYKSGTRS